QLDIVLHEVNAVEIAPAIEEYLAFSAKAVNEITAELVRSKEPDIGCKFVHCRRSRNGKLFRRKTSASSHRGRMQDGQRKQSHYWRDSPSFSAGIEFPDAFGVLEPGVKRAPERMPHVPLSKSMSDCAVGERQSEQRD